jgi:hypothetical protein
MLPDDEDRPGVLGEGIGGCGGAEENTKDAQERPLQQEFQ